MDIFRKSMTLIAFLFVRLCPAKSVVRYMCKNPASDYPSKRNMENWSQLFKLERQHLWHIYWSTGRKLSWKKSLLVIWESLRLFLNTMSGVHKCSLPHRDNLMEPIYMQLSQKLKTFCSFILHLQSLAYILNLLKKRMTLIAYFLSEARALEKRG